MLGLGDVTCIGIPALRYFKQQFPEAELHMLTYAAGKDIIELAEPDVKVMALAKDQWPDNIYQAMESFLKLAEQIIGEEYCQIINLDTWFMPCFLARFLKDAGEPVQGNMMSVSVQRLISELSKETLSPDYVHDPANYIKSSFFCMSRWHTPWWEMGYLHDYGYPEFYLRSCCGFDTIDMDMSIKVEKNQRLAHIGRNKKVIAIAPDARTPERSYPHAAKLQKLLTKAGFHVWTGFDGRDPMRKTLANLAATDLLVTAPSAPQWLATTVGCPSLVICGDVDPRTLMPDYATEQEAGMPAPEELAESIISVFAEQTT